MRHALLLCGVVGCSAQLGPDPGATRADDDGTRPDAALTRTPDAAAPDAAPLPAADNACGVASDHGDLGSLAGQAGAVLQEGSTTQRIAYIAAATPRTAMQPTPDFVVVELWDNYGVFAGGPARPGTFSITGNETDYDTCGVCVLLLADYTNNAPTKLLLATSGTVTVTSVGTAAGQTTQLSVANASFVEIALDPNVGYQAVAGSSCPSPIANVALSDTL